jgi:hypothetical protein
MAHTPELGGRHVYPHGVADGALWFQVGNVLIETGPQFRNARARMAVAPEVIEDVAAYQARMDRASGDRLTLPALLDGPDGAFVAGSLITAGALGDRIGRRRLLLIGAACFGAASVLAAFSKSAAMLIVTRALLGLAGATVAPSTLSLIRNMFLHRASARRRSGFGS